MLTLHFRTCPRYDLNGALISWLESSSSDKPDLESSEVREDLLRLYTLRDQMSISNSNISIGKEYHACLMECQRMGFPDNTPLKLEWTGAFLGDVQVHSHLSWERANVLWNVAAFESHTASLANLTDKRALSKAVKQYQSAASLIRHIMILVENKSFPGVDMSPCMLLFWETIFLAQGQMCCYYMAGAGGKPKHLLLAKLATAVVPLLNESLEACQKLKGVVGLDHRSWALYVRGWSLVMASKAHYHDSVTHKEKGRWGMELARLEKSLTLATECKDLLKRKKGISISPLLTESLTKLLKVLMERYQQAQEENDSTHHEPIPTLQELREIRGELLAKGNQPLPIDMQQLKVPMFTNTLGDMAKSACEAFRRDMDALIRQMSQLVETKMESARKQLAAVNLPHSLTAYKQEKSGGGIPMDLWLRVEAIQKSNGISKLRTELWELRDVSGQARSIYKRACNQLDDDLQLDHLFREQNPDFDGHDIDEVQRAHRNSLPNYEKLLQKSQDGDAVLLRRLEILDTDPKYKLLQFQKAQLDRLLPGSADEPMIETSTLSRLLVELSTLFHERGVTLELLKYEVKSYNIRRKVASINKDSPNAEKEYQQAVIMSQKSFSGIAYEIQLNIDKQMDLMDTILMENEAFMARRDAGPLSATTDSCIVMIEDAIEEIDQLSKHLKEGKDFYKIVIPKLEQLHQQVGDASVRLTVERYDYEDSHRNNSSRRQQELEDARMAQDLNNATTGRAVTPHLQDTTNSEISPDVMPMVSMPGMVRVPHDEPQVRVDDEKVASLIAMDFDPDKVVAALKKYDNNVDQALNELLSC